MLARANRLLTWNRACFWATLLVILYVVAYSFVLINGHLPLNASNEPVGGDYLPWTIAILAGIALLTIWDYGRNVAVP